MSNTFSCLRIGPKRRLWLSLLLIASGISSASAAEEESGRFVRVRRDDRGGVIAMETSIVRFVIPGDGTNDKRSKPVIIDLVGAIHIGDRSYYDDLNKELDKYDVVLYELVAEEGTRIPKNAEVPNGHPVGMMQNGMKGVLELEHQLSSIDYERDHFVHADMTPEQLAESMAERGDGFMEMFFRMMGYGIAQQSKDPSGSADARLLMALFDSNRALALKRVMAEQLADVEGAMMILAGPEGSSLITERNKVALEVLREQMEAGERRIAIFYGAGHMPDFVERLEAEFGAKRRGTRWFIAWDMRDASDR